MGLRTPNWRVGLIVKRWRRCRVSIPTKGTGWREGQDPPRRQKPPVSAMNLERPCRYHRYRRSVAGVHWSSHEPRTRNNGHSSYASKKHKETTVISILQTSACSARSQNYDLPHVGSSVSAEGLRNLRKNDVCGYALNVFTLPIKKLCINQERCKPTSPRTDQGGQFTPLLSPSPHLSMVPTLL